MSGYQRLGHNASINEMLQQLTSKNKQLERMSGLVGSSSDTAQWRSRLDKTRHDAQSLCKELHSALKTGQSSQMTPTLRDSFKNQVQLFSRICQEIERKDQAVVAVMAQSTRSGAGGGTDSSPLLGDDSLVSDMRMDAEQQQMMAQIDQHFQEYDVEEMKRRRDGIKSIERDVTELGEMYRDLQEMVVQQGEQFNRIEDSIIGAKSNVEAGEDELIQAEELQKKARKRQCCILFIVLLLVATLVLIGVLASKK